MIQGGPTAGVSLAVQLIQKVSLYPIFDRIDAEKLLDCIGG